jgi:hypothetical protein
MSLSLGVPRSGMLTLCSRCDILLLIFFPLPPFSRFPELQIPLSATTATDLPDEVLGLIFEYLSVADLGHCGRVTSRWGAVVWAWLPVLRLAKARTHVDDGIIRMLRTKCKRLRVSAMIVLALGEAEWLTCCCCFPGRCWTYRSAIAFLIIPWRYYIRCHF